MLDVVDAVASRVFIPLSVGGGIRSVLMQPTETCWCRKINVNSAAVLTVLISDCAEKLVSERSIVDGYPSDNTNKGMSIRL